MTDIQPITNGTEPGWAKNPPEFADPPHAYVENGDLFILDGGVYWRFDNRAAWLRWFDAVQSSIPSTRERARQIRAAMDEAFPQQVAA